MPGIIWNKWSTRDSWKFFTFCVFMASNVEQSTRKPGEVSVSFCSVYFNWICTALWVRGCTICFPKAQRAFESFNGAPLHYLLFACFSSSVFFLMFSVSLIFHNPIFPSLSHNHISFCLYSSIFLLPSSCFCHFCLVFFSLFMACDHFILYTC